MNKLNYDFFNRDILIVAENLIGKYLVFNNVKYIVSELEIYRGEDDTACHASRGITKRTKVLYDRAGTIYVYLCYGIHNMLNIVTGKEGQPQAILIRGLDNIYGPGKITKKLGINRSLNGKTVFGKDLYFEDNKKSYTFHRYKRIGINYANEIDRNRLWNFKIEEKDLNYG